MSPPPALDVLLDASLVPHGFARPRGGLRWQRRVGELEHVVGLRRSRSGNGTAVWFQAERDGAPLGAALELSPVAPLSNTWWWPTPLENSDADALRSQLQQIVLPYFAALPLDRDAIERELAAALSPLTALAPAFVHDAQVYWRRREGVIDLVVSELLAEGCFVRIWFAVWHEDLASGLAGELPAGVTLAASHLFGRDGIDGAPLQAFYRTGGGDPQACLDGAAISQAAAAWFADIRHVADVKARIRPEYRGHFEAT